MGSRALAAELAGSHELYNLEASESEPEEQDDEQDGEEEQCSVEPEDTSHE